MPAYNVGLYISDAIQSVLNQSYPHWELLVINDGSTDNTEQVVQSFKEDRIRYFYQQNGGVSKARNLGLQEMKGNFFCFLDGDDLLPKDSLKHRIDYALSNPDLTFIDGYVVTYDSNLTSVTNVCKPSFRGNPFYQITRLRSSCLCAISWMVRIEKGKVYEFKTGWSHSEDMAFYLSLSEDQGTKYGYINEPVYHIRKREGSAMTNLDGLANGYINLYQYIFKDLCKSSVWDQIYFKYRITRIMALSYLRRRQISKAIKIAFKYLFI